MIFEIEEIRLSSALFHLISKLSVVHCVLKPLGDTRSALILLLLYAFRDSGEPTQQADQQPEDSSSLAAAVHASEQPFPAGLQEALPDAADLWKCPEWHPEPQIQKRKHKGGRKSRSRASSALWDPLTSRRNWMRAWIYVDSIAVFWTIRVTTFV